MSIFKCAHSSEMTSSHHIDLWEHASKLYHWHRWQQAADIFAFLAKDIASPRQRTICLLNNALVEARLGDYDTAITIITKAMKIGEELHITSFLAGLLNAELGQLDSAEEWFDACLIGLDGQDIDYVADGLDIVLDCSSVRHNLETVGQALLARELGFEDAAPDDLIYVPAEYLFEAPARSGEPSPTVDREMPFGAGVLGDGIQGANGVSEVLSRLPSSGYSPATMSEKSLKLLFTDEIFESPGEVSFEQARSTSPSGSAKKAANHTASAIVPSKAFTSPAQPSPDSLAKALRSIEGMRQRVATVHRDTAGSRPTPKIKVSHTWHGQQRIKHEPRDARGVSDSVRELAHFVKEFAPDDSHPVRRLVTEDERDKLAFDDGRAASVTPDHRDYYHIARKIGAITPIEGQDNATAQQRPRAATVGEQDGSRPSFARAFTLPVRHDIRPRSILSTNPDGLTRPPLKATKVRWPFQRDIQESSSEPPSTPQPAAAASTTGAGANRPVPLDFIMGPGGKTIVLEKAATTSAPVVPLPLALKQVHEARLHGTGEQFDDERESMLSAMPVSSHLQLENGNDMRSPTHDRIGEDAQISLHPTVYTPSPPEPTSKYRPAVSTTTIPSTPPTAPNQTMTRKPIPPVPPSSTQYQHNHNHRYQTRPDSLTPLPLNPSHAKWRQRSATSPSPQTPTSSLRGRWSRYSPSVVSSVNMWDYLLEKAGVDGKERKGERRRRRSKEGMV